MKLAITNRSAGLTLIELLLALVIFTILLLQIWPSLQSILYKTQQQAQTDILAARIYYLRQQAAAYGVAVVLCTSEFGQRAFVDFSRSRSYKPEQDILLGEWLVKLPAKLSWRGFTSNRYLVIHPLVLSNAMTGSFYYQAAPNKKEYKIISINRAGRVLKY